MEWGAKALQAARRLNLLTDATINQILVKVAEEAIANTSYILAENQKDLDAMDKNNPMYDRLLLSTDRIQGIAADIRNVASLPSPLGQAVTKEIFKRNPKKLHVVDISENNMVELVRDIRSSFGYINGDFQTFALDIGSSEYDAFIKSDGKYDYVLNLSALKHVRSEKDPFTLMRMIETNIFNTDLTLIVTGKQIGRAHV